MTNKNDVFVFGSNLSGYHGAGAAKTAHQLYGAVWGRGVGLYGRSYALPTKDHKIRTLTLDEIRTHVDDFIYVVRSNPDRTFWVTRIGCGLAGYSDRDIAPMFNNIILPSFPDNVKLPRKFLDIILPGEYKEFWVSFEV